MINMRCCIDWTHRAYSTRPHDSHRKWPNTNGTRHCLSLHNKHTHQWKHGMKMLTEALIARKAAAYHSRSAFVRLILGTVTPPGAHGSEVQQVHVGDELDPSLPSDTLQLPCKEACRDGSISDAGALGVSAITDRVSLLSLKTPWNATVFSPAPVYFLLKQEGRIYPTNRGCTHDKSEV